MNEVELTQALIRCPSVTPEEGGALVLLEHLLRDAGFETARVDRNGVANLFARFGKDAPVFAFNGHTDVVPVGNIEDWTKDPFGGEIIDDKLFGRGACDMKSGVAAFVAAAIEFVKTPFQGSIVLMITGDEEADALDGTRALIDYVNINHIKLDHALIGEPTSPNFMGEMIKPGRRGSFTAFVTAEGKQGHVAYPERAANPISALLPFLHDLNSTPLDKGYAHFNPSNLEIVSVDVGNVADNVIPNRATAKINIRYNPNHTAERLQAHFETKLQEYSRDGVTLSANYRASGDAFLTEESPFTHLVQDAVEEVTGHRPVLSTTGGTSDARFMKDLCPVVECGLVGTSMHAVDEYVYVEHITQLRAIYARILEVYFST